ncbi:two-component response regulator colocalized with HrtAB transporter [Bacillus sp. JCM 19046]|nr:two-component response regulator colocalized with HrtAB transporter [Bacillus sp. JCM 19046]
MSVDVHLFLCPFLIFSNERAIVRRGMIAWGYEQMREKILVVDDDASIRDVIKRQLELNDYHVVEAKHGEEALDLLAENEIDLAVVDLMMPFLDGYELCKEIRTDFDIPILILSAKDQLLDKEKAFIVGTDDYLTKPFEPKELIFRIKALLRRYLREQVERRTVGQTTIDRTSYEVIIHDRVLMLPLKEFELLDYLASQPGRTFTRTQLIDRVWGNDFAGDERTVDVHIKRLRERLNGKNSGLMIETIRSVGYKVEVQD